MNILDDLHKDGHLHHKKEPFFCAVVLIACRESNDPSCARTSAEISHVMCDTHGNRSVGNPDKIGEEVKKIMEIRPKTRHIQAPDLVCRFCGYLGLDYDCEKRAREILAFFNSFTPSYCEGKQEARCAAIAIEHSAAMYKSAVTSDRIEHIANCNFGVSKSTLRKDIRNLKSSFSSIGTQLRDKFPRG